MTDGPYTTIKVAHWNQLQGRLLNAERVMRAVEAFLEAEKDGKWMAQVLRLRGEFAAIDTAGKIASAVERMRLAVNGQLG